MKPGRRQEGDRAAGGREGRHPAGSRESGREGAVYSRRAGSERERGSAGGKGERERPAPGGSLERGGRPEGRAAPPDRGEWGGRSGRGE